ncbi:MAG: hypothetical protein JJ992_00985 [Planctomycetes bacterium]|nr:hypothetical protein [Planctomycetota bacterium]
MRKEAFQRYRECVGQLLRNIPSIQRALESQGDQLPLEGWQSMQLRFQAFEQQDAEPVMVATLYGPSGAGKSAWFRQLTGIDVPSGDVVRPMTFACAMAVPQSLNDAERLGRLFPGFSLEPLDDVDELRRPGADDDRLLYVSYAPEAETQPLPLVLVDVPDFNTVEQANWDKAERVLDRAEVVVFVVFGDAYKDDRVISELARCCRKAGFLAYLFTKTKPAAAQAKWRDLLDTVQRFESFQQQRNDGRALHAFLACCDAYTSPLRETPQLSDITPLRENAPSLASLLRGQDAVRIVLTGLLESTSQAVAACRDVLGIAKTRRDTYRRALQRVTHEVDVAAQTIASSQFPAGRLVELAIDVSQRNLHWSARILRFPVTLVSRHGKAAVRSLLGWLYENPDNDEVRQRPNLERDRLHEFVERLIDRFRSLYPEQASPGGMLQHARCAAVRDAFFEQPLPAPAENWEDVVCHALEGWCRNNRLLSHLLVISGDVMLAAGAAAIVVDLGTTGGVVGTVGLPALAGTGSVVAARILEKFDNLQLKKVAEQAYDGWREQRRRELARHLQENFADRLFAPWRECLDQLHDETIDRCNDACIELSTLAKELGVSR